MCDCGLQACSKNLIGGMPLGYDPVRDVPHVPNALCELQVDVEAVESLTMTNAPIKLFPGQDWSSRGLRGGRHFRLGRIAVLRVVDHS